MTTIPNFMLPGETIQNLYNEGGVYASLASSLFNPTGSPTYRVFATGTNAGGPTPVPEGWNETPVLIYTAYSDFVTDLNEGNIHRNIYSWVGYDLEQQGSGPTYPTDEEYPVEYLQLFGQLAHFNGFSCVALPGMDLGNTALDPAKTSGTNEEWYENNQIALVCGQYFDAMVCQAQSLQNTYSSWQSLISNSSGQFASPFDEGTTEWPNVGNAAGIFFGELSTSISETSAALMEDCWTEGSFTPPAGLYLNSQNSAYVMLYDFLNDLFG